MSDTGANQGKDEAARQAAKDRRTEAGKDPKSFGKGGNPDKGEDDETTEPVDPNA